MGTIKITIFWKDKKNLREYDKNWECLITWMMSRLHQGRCWPGLKKEETDSKNWEILASIFICRKAASAFLILLFQVSNFTFQPLPFGFKENNYETRLFIRFLFCFWHWGMTLIGLEPSIWDLAKIIVVSNDMKCFNKL